MEPFLFVVFAVFVASANSFAQTEMVPPAHEIEAPSTSTWPTILAEQYSGPIEIITFAQPGVRHKCHARTIGPDSLTCGRGRKAVVYSRDDIAVIVSPPDHRGRHAAVMEFAVSAASLAGSFFVPIEGVAIALRVASGILLWSGWCDATDHIVGDVFGNLDHDGDILLYRSPGAPLTVELR
jgi:hypothetical protein